MSKAPNNPNNINIITTAIMQLKTLFCVLSAKNCPSLLQGISLHSLVHRCVLSSKIGGCCFPTLEYKTIALLVCKLFKMNKLNEKCKGFLALPVSGVIKKAITQSKGC